MEKDGKTTTNTSFEGRRFKILEDIKTPEDLKMMMAFLRKRQQEMRGEPNHARSNKKDHKNAPMLKGKCKMEGGDRLKAQYSRPCDPYQSRQYRRPHKEYERHVKIAKNLPKRINRKFPVS